MTQEDVVLELVLNFAAEEGTNGEEILSKVEPAVAKEAAEGRLPTKDECAALIFGIDQDGEAVIPESLKEKFPHITTALDSFY